MVEGTITLNFEADVETTLQRRADVPRELACLLCQLLAVQPHERIALRQAFQEFLSICQTIDSGTFQ
jgi:hypothetical protein